jgi:hypothetical protein
MDDADIEVKVLCKVENVSDLNHEGILSEMIILAGIMKCPVDKKSAREQQTRPTGREEGIKNLHLSLCGK